MRMLLVTAAVTAIVTVSPITPTPAVIGVAPAVAGDCSDPTAVMPKLTSNLSAINWRTPDQATAMPSSRKAPSREHARALSRRKIWTATSGFHASIAHLLINR
jgi:hypothetical protein